MQKILRFGLFLAGHGLLVGCGGQTTVIDPTPGPDPAPVVVVPRGPGDSPVAPPDKPTEPPPPVVTSVNSWGTSLDPNTCFSLVEGGTGRRMVKIDLTTGQQADGPNVTQNGNPMLSEMTSIGVKGADLWLCNTNQGSPIQTVTKVSLATGVATGFAVPCRAVTASEQGIFVLGNDTTTITRYADETAVQAGGPSETRIGSDAYSIGPAATGALTSRYQDGQVATSGGAVTLDGYSGYIFGVSEATGGRIIVSSPAIFGGSGSLESFDATTGSRLGTVAKFTGPTGLAGFWGLACAH